MRQLSEGHTQAAMRNVLIAVIVSLVAILLVILIPRLGKKAIEKFKAETFASAVLAQNPKVFERLAEM